ncbi:hypothetical protein GCM10009809_04030 [Isoptericola hypogeus]|uniref:ABC-2 type transport system permease protein n=1 Tax=Isoptericola hypogeus TaxID=300179 RepID=A0ABN2ISN2_9MICO
MCLFLLCAASATLLDRATLVRAFGTTGVSGWDLVIESLANPYLICFVAVPGYLVVGSSGAPTATAWERMARHGSRTRTAATYAIDGVLAAVPFVVGWLVVVLAIAAPYGLAGGWGPAVMAGLAEPTVAAHLVELPPLAAVGCQLILLLCSAWAIGVTLALVAAWTEGLLTLRMIGLALWLWTLLSFKIAPDAPLALRPIAYLTVHHAASSGATAWALACGSVGIGAGLLAASHAAERSRIRLARPRGTSLYALIATLLLVGAELMKGNVTDDGQGGFAPVFFGASPDHFDPQAVTLNLALTAGAAFTLHVGLIARLHHGPHAELVRCRSALHWWWLTYARRTVVMAVAVPSAAVAVHTLVMLAVHGSWSLGASDRVAAFLVLATAAQLLVYVLLMSAATFASGREVAGLVVLGAAVAGTLPILFALDALPVAQNSLSLVWDGASPVRPALLLSIWGGAGLAVTAWALRRRGAELS